MELYQQEIDDDNEFSDKFGGYISFADVGNQPSIQYAPVWDLNKKLIHVPYTDTEEKMKTLIDNYLKVTQCHDKIKDPKNIYFRHKQRNAIISKDIYILKHWITSFKSKKIEIVYIEQNIEDEICQLSVNAINNTDYYNPIIHKQNPNSKQISIKIKSATNTFKPPFQIKVKEDSRVGYVKTVIVQNLKTKYNLNVPLKLLRVVHIGSAIKDGTKLEQIPIRQGGTISVLIQQIISQQDFAIRVKKSEEETILVGDIQKGQKIRNIFDYVTQGINPQDKEKIYMTYKGIVLELDKRLTDYKIQNRSLILLLKRKNQNSLIQSHKSVQGDLQFTLKVDQFTQCQLDYESVKNLTVKQIIGLAKPGYSSKPQNEQFWSIYYGERIVYPFQKFYVLEKLIKNNCTVEVLKNQKYFFYKLLKEDIKFCKDDYKLKLTPAQQKNHQLFKTNFEKRLKQNIRQNILRSDHENVYVKESFYNPIQCYSCNFYYKKLNTYLRQMNVSDKKDFHADQEFKLANSLICKLKQLPNYIGTVYRGMNYKFTDVSDPNKKKEKGKDLQKSENNPESKQEKQKKQKNRQTKQGNVICFSAFTSASRQQKTAQRFMKGTQGKRTLFRIQSLTGKPVQSFSLYNSEKQVLFTPFSYFHIDYIKSSPDSDLDEIWLTQMPTPQNFKKNLILWVDDIPKNNLKIVPKLQNLNVEIVPVTSTRIANFWMKQFSYLLTYLGVKFRVISDMVRYQNLQGKRIEPPNYEAGLELIVDFNTIHQYTTKIIIFCGNAQRAKQTTQKINNKHIKDKIWSVTTSIKALQQFCKFKGEQNKI